MKMLKKYEFKIWHLCPIWIAVMFSCYKATGVMYWFEIATVLLNVIIVCGLVYWSEVK